MASEASTESAEPEHHLGIDDHVRGIGFQAARLRPEWLLSRLYWQGASTASTRRMLGYDTAVWWELPRRMAVAILFAPAMVVPRGSTRLLGMRWRLAYAAGFVRAALGWRAAQAAARSGDT